MNALPVFLPDGFSPVVSVGDTVSAGTIIAHYTSPDEHIVNIAAELEIPLQKVKHVLKKNPGDHVREGDVIAVKKNFFGSEQAAIISQVEGIVARYERNTGNLIIKTTSQSPIQKIISPVDGTIALCDNKQIVISTTSESVAGRKAIGESREGEVFILEASFADEDGDNLANVLYHLDNRAIGKIVIGGEFTREMLAKAVGIGAIGMVGTKIEEYDLAYIAERNKEIPVLEIETEQMRQIRTWKNARVYLDTQAKTLLKINV